MREPNLDAAIECLSLADIVEELSKNKSGAGEELAQILFFCQQEKIPTFIDAIRGLPEEKKERILNSLFNLYPMTRLVIFEFLRRHDTEPADFLRTFDVDNQLLKQIKKTLLEIKNKSTASNHSVNEYKEEIDELDKIIQEKKEEMDQLRESEGDYQDKKHERDAICREVEELKREIQEGELDKEIEELEREKRQLEARKAEDTKRFNQLKKEIQLIRDTLQDTKKSSEDKDYQGALKALERCIKQITKEG